MSHLRRIFLAILIFTAAAWLYKQWRSHQPQAGLFNLLDKKASDSDASPNSSEGSDTPALSQLDREISSLAERVLPSVVSINTNDAKQLGSSNFYKIVPSLGSGVIVSKEGRILTNNHVIANALEIFVTTNDGKTYKADRIGENPQADIAAIQIKDANREFPVLKFANSDQVKVGQTVFAVGNPFGLSGSFTQGIISARRNSPQAGNLFQTDTVINPGNSGGPLVNIYGDIIGINVSIYRGDQQVRTWQGVGLAIPANDARLALENIKPRPIGFLGITTDEVVIQVTPGRIGLTINEVVPKSSAANAGLLQDDVIIGINGEPLEHPDEVFIVAAATPIGRPIVFNILRNKQPLTITATMQPRPQS